MKLPKELTTGFFGLWVVAFSGSVVNSSPPTQLLRNGVHIPLIGVGVGNLQHDLIPEIIHSSFQDHNVRLIDTARASNNERIIAEAIVKVRPSRNTRVVAVGADQDTVHIVTKVWYTHLGYERTKISVLESLRDLASAPNVRLHLLLHWPRCDDSIPWMECEREENDLPQYVKDAGSPPHLDKADAWKESWRALEDLYTEHNSKDNKVNGPLIASIGVSNFDIDDLSALLEMANIKPHMYQGNVWNVVHNPHLMYMLRDHQIFFQAYGIMGAILQKAQESPIAFSILTDVAKELSLSVKGIDDFFVSEGMVVSAWLVQSRVGVIPRAASPSHQRENSPSSIASLPALSEEQLSSVDHATKSLMRGEEAHVAAAFENALPGPMQLHWVHFETGEEVLVSEFVPSGDTVAHLTHPGHKFVAYDTEREVRREFVVDVPYGTKQHFSIEL